MSTRLDSAFGRMRQEQRTGLVAFVSGGDPTLEKSGAVIRAVDEAGADVIEIGVPFSDPAARPRHHRLKSPPATLAPMLRSA